MVIVNRLKDEDFKTILVEHPRFDDNAVFQDMTSDKYEHYLMNICETARPIKK